MDENELKVELECYKQYFNPSCDLDNMTKEEVEEFYKLYVDTEKYKKDICFP